jgi:hypothetical protein
MSRGLGENLSRALHGVDSALEHTVGRLRKTILESNETIDRMTVPIRATETTALEMRAALDQVRADIVSLNNWLIRVSGPVRGTLAQLDDKTTFLTRALQEFGDRARAVEHNMDELRGELRVTGRSRPDTDSTRAGAGPQPEELRQPREPREPKQPEELEVDAADIAEAEEAETALEEDTEHAGLSWEPETEIAAPASGAGAALGDGSAEEDSAREPSREPDPEVRSAIGTPDYRLQAPELFASSPEHDPATTRGGGSGTGDAGEAECDAETAAAVSLSGLLSRPHLAGSRRPAVPTEGERDDTPAADHRPSGSADISNPSENGQDLDSEDSHVETSADSQRTSGHLSSDEK